MESRGESDRIFLVPEAGGGRPRKKRGLPKVNPTDTIRGYRRGGGAGAPQASALLAPAGGRPRRGGSTGGSVSPARRVGGGGMALLLLDGELREVVSHGVCAERVVREVSIPNESDSPRLLQVGDGAAGQCGIGESNSPDPSIISEPVRAPTSDADIRCAPMPPETLTIILVGWAFASPLPSLPFSGFSA
jgi:hypothetical protein